MRIIFYIIISQNNPRASLLMSISLKMRALNDSSRAQIIKFLIRFGKGPWNIELKAPLFYAKGTHKYPSCYIRANNYVNMPEALYPPPPLML